MMDLLLNVGIIIVAFAVFIGGLLFCWFMAWISDLFEVWQYNKWQEKQSAKQANGVKQ